MSAVTAAALLGGDDRAVAQGDALGGQGGVGGVQQELAVQLGLADDGAAVDAQLASRGGAQEPREPGEACSSPASSARLAGGEAVAVRESVAQLREQLVADGGGAGGLLPGCGRPRSGRASRRRRCWSCRSARSSWPGQPLGPEGGAGPPVRYGARSARAPAVCRPTSSPSAWSPWATPRRTGRPDRCAAAAARSTRSSTTNAGDASSDALVRDAGGPGTGTLVDSGLGATKSRYELVAAVRDVDHVSVDLNLAGG